MDCRTRHSYRLHTCSTMVMVCHAGMLYGS